MSDLLNKIKHYLDKGVEASSEALSKAGEKVRDFSDKSVIKIEISKLEGKIQKKEQDLGAFVFDQLITQQKSRITKENTELVAILTEIESLKAEVEKKKETLENFDDTPVVDEKDITKE